MRVLLDESLPRPLGLLLTGHEVRTVAQVGWASFENGELLRAAATRFDVLLTADQNLECRPAGGATGFRRDFERHRTAG
jgi:hypothetical protein